MSLAPVLQHRLRTSLKQHQRLQLKLLLESDRNDGNCPQAVTGVSGLRRANSLLKAHEAVGILIGGLSENIWSQRRKASELLVHKDVDVVVLTNHEFTDVSRFVGGVDWWTPRTDLVSLDTGDASVSQHLTWYENGNRIKLRFGIKQGVSESVFTRPGLYLLDPELVIQMRTLEAESVLKGGADEQVIGVFESRLRRKVRTRLPRFMRELGLPILTAGDFQFQRIDHDLYRAVRRR